MSDSGLCFIEICKNIYDNISSLDLRCLTTSPSFPTIFTKENNSLKPFLPGNL